MSYLLLIMIILAIVAIVLYIKHKDEQEFYISLENVLSKLGDNESNKTTIISTIAKALKDGEKDGTAKISYKNTKTIKTVITEISNDQYELASRKIIVSNQFLFMMILIIFLCLCCVFVSFYSTISPIEFFGINIQEELAIKVTTISITLLVINFLWTGIKIRIKDMWISLKNKFKR
ncbi:hypothetical protein [Glaesserella sp.]